MPTRAERRSDPEGCRRLNPLRASATSSNNAIAAKPDRRLAICHPVKSAALMAAPPVENSSAAPRSWRRGLEAENMGEK
jgi:hypothetical protein